MQGLGKVIRFILWGLMGLFLIWFAISNRTPVMLGLSWTTLFVEATVYSVFFAGILFGLVIAGTVTGWLRLKGFAARRQAERRAKALENDLDTLAEAAHTTVQDARHSEVRDRIEGPGA